MKIILLHSDFIEFEPKKKALKDAEKVEMKKKRVNECLVVLSAVEKQDENNLDQIAKNFVDEIKDVAKQVKTKKIVIYPWVHLSSSPASPSSALKVLKDAEKLLKKDYDVTRSPFGWYKHFSVSVKGHPLSELSREISVGSKKEEKYDPKSLLNQISKTVLDTRKLKENDHRILGERLDLFSFHSVAPGMVFWHNNGLIVYNELVKFWREEHEKAGYKEISTPPILDKKLWQISGHWEKYREHIFLTKYEDRDFAVKPMNCPGGLLVYKTGTKSYKDLPLRIAELGIVNRQELSGVLAGLFRVINFTQDDAHIYCTEKQLEEEIKQVMKLTDKLYKKFGFTYHVELSTRPKKRIGSNQQWDKSEKALENVLKKSKMKYKINKGDGAFYGPKIDFHINDSLDRTWQCATIQVDFAMPERFDINYVDENNKKNRPVLIHRAIYGSLERFIGILLEHTNGNLPVWISPIQARVISFTGKNVKAARKILKEIQDQGIRADADFDSIRVNKKVRNSELMKIPYTIVIGDKEEKNKTLAVRERHKKPKFGVKFDSFLKQITEEVSKRK